MTKRIFGAFFCTASLLSFLTGYLCGVIHFSAYENYDSTLFWHSLELVGMPLFLAGGLLLFVGVVLLIPSINRGAK